MREAVADCTAPPPPPRRFAYDPDDPNDVEDLAAATRAGHKTGRKIFLWAMAQLGIEEDFTKTVMIRSLHAT